MIESGTASGAETAPARPRSTKLEVWAGVECTINRVGDCYFDQLARAGHYNRLDDIDRLADLGVRTLRYPILWERHATNDSHWDVTDAVMARMHDVGIDPIVGLVHHGSGPEETSLVAESFADGLATHAARVVRRYPWVRRYTPVNEPLTTARFSCLYGHWHPHLRDDDAFVRALLEQTRATQRAMRVIRTERPDALLVQSEDLGYTHTTPELAEQGVFENERRWLTFDLLLGLVRRGHPLFHFLARHQTLRAALEEIADTPTPPDLIGLNHYVTSERYLDHRLERFPIETHGGNGRMRYADVEAVRALHHGVRGLRRLLTDAWERYRLPIAITEAHLGCSREQQLRWLRDVFEAAHEARASGIDVRAVTAWSALGSFNWPSLLTRDDGEYEPGLFDVRSEPPRATALARLVEAQVRGEAWSHPTLASRGWWQCERRLSYGIEHQSTVLRLRESDRAVPLKVAVETEIEQTIVPNAAVPTRPSLANALMRERGMQKGARPILLAGSEGTLGRAIVAKCAERNLAVVALSRRDLDITDARRVAEVLDEVRPWSVINAAGFVRVDDAEKERETCRWINTIGPAVLADRCLTRSTKLVTFSSDLVFDGTKSSPYVESDLPAPLNIYGHSKHEAERLVRELLPNALVVRTSAFFGDHDEHNFLTRTLAALTNGKRVRVASDLTITATYVPQLVDTMLDLLIDDERGVWHVANEGEVTWAELAREAASLGGVSTSRLVAVPHAELGTLALRPRRSSLASERGRLMPSVRSAVERWVHGRPWLRLQRRGGRSGGDRSAATLPDESSVAVTPGAEP